MSLTLTTRMSLGLAAVISVSWLASLIILLRLDLHGLPWWALAGAILVRTQLQTGLFIIGHDAMHRILWPNQRRLNDSVGMAALALYAALPYQTCRANHQLHHKAPATDEDPDFPSALHPGILSWYRQFMAGYLNAAQMAVLLGVWILLALTFSAMTPTAALNVLTFCTVPLLLSSLQLFIFGTYLPHRGQRAPGRQLHPLSLDLPTWLSLIACFHFGYHREHHDNPVLCWFELPAARARTGKLAITR